MCSVSPSIQELDSQWNDTEPDSTPQAHMTPKTQSEHPVKMMLRASFRLSIKSPGQAIHTSPDEQQSLIIDTCDVHIKTRVVDKIANYRDDEDSVC